MLHMKAASYKVIQESSDADTLIVLTVLNLVAQKPHVTVVASDTDVLVLLVYHWKSSMATVVIR